MDFVYFVRADGIKAGENGTTDRKTYSECVSVCGGILCVYIRNDKHVRGSIVRNDQFITYLHFIIRQKITISQNIKKKSYISALVLTFTWPHSVRIQPSIGKIFSPHSQASEFVKNIRHANKQFSRQKRDHI